MRNSQHISCGIGLGLAALALIALSACADGYVPQANVGDDASSDTSVVDATIDADERPDGGLADGTSADARPDTEVDDDGGLNDPDGGPSGGCQPDHDGVLERDEFLAEPGLAPPYEVAEEVEVDTGGVEQDGTRVWDLTGPYAGDEQKPLPVLDVEEQWFAQEFPDATYAVRLSLQEGEETLGVYKLTPDALLLQGVVSPEEGLYETELTYDPDIPILKFPMAKGDSWSVDSDVTGRYNGTPVGVISEQYDVEVDAEGEVITPYGRFPTLRVYTNLDRQWGWFPDSVRTMSFAVECFGTVATIRSDGNADQKNFQEAAELRRLTK